MKVGLDTVITSMLVICAMVTTSVVVRREFYPPNPTPSSRALEPVQIPGWQAFLAKARRMGPVDAPVQLMEFADFECPFCSIFHKDLKILLARYPNEVTLNFFHFPLSMHRVAEQASRVAECAGEQGRFKAMHDLLFERQSTLGVTPWTEFGDDAGVPNRAMFEECIQLVESVPRIEEGLELGKKLDVQGTPTLIINGWKLAQPPKLEELDRMVKAIIAGKKPITSG